MPQPVPLATKEEEDRRAWVTAHHEVVRLIKDCFGDRFSNNEIFDRLKISRRTGYRALGNDERIGKAPGRKPKILDSTIREMIDYIESGGCNDVGNVWKHLAEKFAPDCNPKTVQDAVKKSGFRNHRDSVKLEPLLDQQLSDTPQAAVDDASVQQLQQADQQQQQQPQPQQHDTSHQQLQQEPPTAIDPVFQQQTSVDSLRTAIETGPDQHIRITLLDICAQYPEAARFAASYLCPSYVAPPAPPPRLAQIGAHHLHPGLEGPPLSPNDNVGKRSRSAVCRRCGQAYDRAQNTMEKRACLYHKGSPQKISPEDVGTLAQSPEAYIWSCCGGNGNVRGCCRAMHTTKKKRKYGKKRDANAAGLDMDGVDDSGIDEPTSPIMLNGHQHMPNGNHHMPATNHSNIDTALQELQAATAAPHANQLPNQLLQMHMAAAAQPVPPSQQHGGHSHALMQQHIPMPQTGGMMPTQMPPDVQLQMATT